MHIYRCAQVYKHTERLRHKRTYSTHTKTYKHIHRHTDKHIHRCTQADTDRQTLTKPLYSCTGNAIRYLGSKYSQSFAFLSKVYFFKCQVTTRDQLRAMADL